jgi:hypothetical protein
LGKVEAGTCDSLLGRDNVYMDAFGVAVKIDGTPTSLEKRSYYPIEPRKRR